MPSLRTCFCLLFFMMPLANAANPLPTLPDQDFLVLRTQLEAQALSNPLNIEQQYQLAISYWRLGMLKEARTSLNKLLKLNPDYTQAHYLSGIVSLSLVGEVNIFRKIGMAKRALASWNETLTLNKQHVKANFAVFSFYLNAPGIAGGDLELAEKWLAKLKTVNYPYHQMAHGLLLAKKGKPENAEQLLIEASKTIEHRATPLFQLAQFYLQQEKFVRAQQTLKTYLLQPRYWHDPSENMVLFLMHLAEKGLGNQEAAKKHLERAIELTGQPSARARMSKALDQF
ncbi:MAG TPA: tetratricopeptide repeat protein [Gammaproteobacteria bacterium]|nr:tetratricopeptide repeat protein [Gammaproteobacteria bacterium]HIK70565.1 tetratricopeptide repeat protein [Pseudomonadales bacterium]